MCPVRLQVVDFREHPPQPANVNRLVLQPPAARQQRQLRQDLLRPPSANVGISTLPLRFNARSIARLNRSISAARVKSGGTAAVAACRFHDQHVRPDVFKPRALQDGLVPERNVARVKQRLLLPRTMMPADPSVCPRHRIPASATASPARLS